MMKYKGYVGEVNFDPESQTYSGTVVNCSDTIHFEAGDATQLEQAFRESVEDYLAFVLEEGVAPRPPRPALLIELEEGIYEKISNAARQEGEAIDSYLIKYLEKSFSSR